MTSGLGHHARERAEHVVQFYASDDELLTVLGARVTAALARGDAVIVIADEDHRHALDVRVRGAGLDVEAARDDGRLLALDARGTLARLMPDGSIDPEAFSDVVGSTVRAAAATGRHVLAFGEMVALLWEAGDVMAAIDLERLWEDLAADVGCTVYCAYRSETTAGADLASALERVCDLHSAVVPAPSPAVTWHFAAEAAAAADARRLLTDVVRRGGHDGDLLDDARLVVSELAANAVLHARSPFTVSVRVDPASVRIEVEDASATVPVVRPPDPVRPSGRGMYLVAGLARRWGVEPRPRGKLVWAELG